MGRRRIAFALTIATAALPAGRAGAVILDIAPAATVGATDNPTGSDTSVSGPQWTAFLLASAAAHLRYTHARAHHLLGYGVHLTRYPSRPDANNVAQVADWLTEIALSGRANLSLGASAMLFQYSAILATNPATANPNVSQMGGPSIEIFNAGAFESFSYEPNGRAHYQEMLNVTYLRPLGNATATVPESVISSLHLRGDSVHGRDALSLSLVLNAFTPVGQQMMLAGGTPASAGALYGRGDIYTAELLAGWRRDLSTTTTAEIQAGPLAFYGTATGTLGVGPAALATLAYRHLPWYATLTLGQEPFVNTYSAEALLGDSAALRVSLPLDLREAFVISGLAGYTYARRITPEQHFLDAPRAYDLFMLAGSVGYRFQKLPVIAGIEYSIIDRRGSVLANPNPMGLPFGYPNLLRRVIGLTISGTFDWGEGNYGLPARS
jgi:hypothetical protein